jgi:predicted metal-dependent hydrolase
MVKTIELGGVTVDVIRKRIKYVHLRVYPPDGSVRISAPLHMSLAAIRAFAISKLGWIERAQARLRDQERETPRRYLDRESHDVWGERHLLKVVEREAPPCVQIEHGTLVLQVRPGTGVAKRQAVVDRWYRDQTKGAVPALIERWETVIGVKVARLFVQKMRTRWGSCNARAGNIRLNSELAKRPRACLEYVVVHEMAHLLEPTHDRRFIALMDRLMPRWRAHKDALNERPVRQGHGSD